MLISGNLDSLSSRFSLGSERDFLPSFDPFFLPDHLTNFLVESFRVDAGSHGCFFPSNK